MVDLLIDGAAAGVRVGGEWGVNPGTVRFGAWLEL